jgi:hypothetical protein
MTKMILVTAMTSFRLPAGQWANLCLAFVLVRFRYALKECFPNSYSVISRTPEVESL